eukprot:COSAG06_NODE_45558_length_354_cov_0.407843_1_plen_28_part_10
MIGATFKHLNLVGLVPFGKKRVCGCEPT